MVVKTTWCGYSVANIVRLTCAWCDQVGLDKQTYQALSGVMMTELSGGDVTKEATNNTFTHVLHPYCAEGAPVYELLC